MQLAAVSKATVPTNEIAFLKGGEVFVEAADVVFIPFKFLHFSTEVIRDPSWTR